jgi:hypothetical protein
MYCDKGLMNCPWNCAGQTFYSQFKFLPLDTYEGILGLDWLTKHSPMKID